MTNYDKYKNSIMASTKIDQQINLTNGNKSIEILTLYK